MQTKVLATKSIKTFGDVHLQIIDVSKIAELPRITKEIITNYPDFSLLVNNAVIESFHTTLKKELVHHEHNHNSTEAKFPLF